MLRRGCQGEPWAVEPVRLARQLREWLSQFRCPATRKDVIQDQSCSGGTPALRETRHSAIAVAVSFVGGLEDRTAGFCVEGASGKQRSAHTSGRISQPVPEPLGKEKQGMMFPAAFRIAEYSIATYSSGTAQLPWLSPGKIGLHCGFLGCWCISFKDVCRRAQTEVKPTRVSLPKKIPPMGPR